MIARLTVTIFLALQLVSGAAEPDPGLHAGLAAYFAGDFDHAAVGLKRLLATEPRGSAAAATYFLGRSFQELGLRGLALHYLGQAEAFTPWRLEARRELARLYLQVNEYPAVLEVVRRLTPEEREDPELAYLGGIAAAALGRWAEADEWLARVAPGTPEHPYALYIRAQSEAARERFEAALVLLGRLAADDAVPDVLRDQARVLRGKILYLADRHEEARREFAAIDSGGSIGFEGLRGLLLVRADAGSAARANVSESRPGEHAALLFVRAVAAEERGDVAAATVVRERLRALVEGRVQALRSVAGSVQAPGNLEQDLARFANLLRDRRWQQRWSDELSRLEESVRSRVQGGASAQADRFDPVDPLFYDAWTQARSDPWLRGSIELLARTRELQDALSRIPGAPPWWRFWEGDDARRLVLALAVVRRSNLERLFADHLHTLEVITIDELRRRKQKSIDDAVADLRRLYLGEDWEIPESLSNLRLHLEYKEADMRRLVRAVPERSTDPVTSLLGNFVDLLEETRAQRVHLEKDSSSEEQASAPDLPDHLRRDATNLEGEIGLRIHEVVLPTLRRQMAYFIRLGADNEASLSRLYARRQGPAGGRE